VPIPGTKRQARLEENVGATAIQLGAADLEELDALSPRGAVAGDRYAPMGMTMINR
jgi:aryl-alcohol dehydrogenase-like predicted oxidoreductase